MSTPPTIDPNLPPDWLDLQHALRAPWQEFFAPRRGACQAVVGRHAHDEEAIDAAVRSFVRGGGWPAMSESEKCLLGARLHWAFCWATAHCAADAKAATAVAVSCEEEALEWLLIEGWHQGGAPFFGQLR